MNIPKEILIYWWRWHFDYTVWYTNEEFSKFKNIIEIYGVDKVLEMAIASYILFDGSPKLILTAIRRNIVNELFEGLPNIYLSCTISKIKEYKRIKQDFINNLIMKYNLDNKN